MDHPDALTACDPDSDERCFSFGACPDVVRSVECSGLLDVIQCRNNGLVLNQVCVLCVLPHVDGCIVAGPVDLIGGFHLLFLIAASCRRLVSSTAHSNESSQMDSHAQSLASDALKP